MAGVKTAKKIAQKFCPRQGRGLYPARSLRKIGTDGTPRIFPGSGNLPQSPANFFLPVRTGSFRSVGTKWSGRKMSVLTVNSGVGRVKPRGLMRRPGRYAKHRALLR